MKKTVLLVAILGYACSSFAWTSSEPKEKFYSFKFKYQNETLEIRKPASSYEEAFEKAAEVCFNHYRKSQGGKLNEERGLDIIDVCANPRS